MTSKFVSNKAVADALDLAIDRIRRNVDTFTCVALLDLRFDGEIHAATEREAAKRVLESIDNMNAFEQYYRRHVLGVNYEDDTTSHEEYRNLRIAHMTELSHRIRNGEV